MFSEGQQIGLYSLIRRLGRGGFGEVWLAERKSKFVTTKVAVKLPLDEQVDHEAIKLEATLWERVSGHPNILPIIDADEYDGQVVIVSEYAPDGSLDAWLKTHGKMPVEKAAELTIKILDGLEFLHSRNIIHRDLKPANILMQGDTPRLADFGISRALRTTASSQSSNVSGTFAYMPPEGFDGRRSVQTDIWSVGVNLYQFLTGNLPYPQKEPSALIAAIMMRDYEPLPSDIPQSIKNIISKALTKQPENRYVSAAAMREDLRRFLRGEFVSDSIVADAQLKNSSFERNAADVETRTSVIGKGDEEETQVRPLHKQATNSKQPKRNLSAAKKRELDSWKYEKTIRRKEEYPVLDSEPVFERPRHKWTSSDYVREITFHITGKHTFHAQENLEILRSHFNELIGDENKILRRSAMQLGKGIFENYDGVFTFNFQSSANPTKENFLKGLDFFLYDDDLLSYRESKPIKTPQPAYNGIPVSIQRFQDSKATDILLLQDDRQNDKLKSSNVWKLATITTFMVSLIGLGVYFLANQSKQVNSNKNGGMQASSTQLNINSANSKNVNASIIHTANIATPPPTETPLSTPLPEKIKNTNVTIRLVELNSDGCVFAFGKFFLRRANGKDYTELGQQFGAYAAYIEKKGVATFKQIPCGETVIIEGSGEVGIRQTINCSKSVYLGTFDINSGRKISERAANNCLLPY
jgi:serine/threonine protein kinase